MIDTVNVLRSLCSNRDSPQTFRNLIFMCLPVAGILIILNCPMIVWYERRLSHIKLQYINVILISLGDAGLFHTDCMISSTVLSNVYFGLKPISFFTFSQLMTLFVARVLRRKRVSRGSFERYSEKTAVRYARE